MKQPLSLKSRLSTYPNFHHWVKTKITAIAQK